MAKIKNQYATALFELSQEANTLEEDLNYAIWIRDSLNDNYIKLFLGKPGISKSVKIQLLQDAFADKVSKHIMGLLHLMIHKNREEYIVPTLATFIEIVDMYFGRIKARIVSAKPLSKAQIDTINSVLNKKTNMQVEIQTEIDPDVIGGFYILVDGKIFDNTVRTSLNNMKKNINKGSVIARVVSAKPLTKNQMDAINDMLSRKVNKDVVISAVVDPDLLGGFYIVVDGYFYDGTVRTQLKNMKKGLMRGKEVYREENLNGK